MADAFETASSGLSSPATKHATITPNDSADIPNRPRAIKCLAAGTVAIRDELGTDITYTVLQGDVLQIRAARVLATGTSLTAAQLIAWW
jgi:hypothetical protein